MNKFSRTFKLWGFTISHSFLILRSQMKFPDQEEYSEENNFNIDIEFSAVAYIDLPSILKGITIREIVENIPEKFRPLKDGLGFKVFEINSENNFYYIVAGSYSIGKNSWISEDRIINSLLNHDEIIAPNS